MKFKKIFSLVFVFGFLNIYAQNINLPKEIKSPIASSLGRFGDVPISYFTGRANVSVPLFSINENNIELKMDLNYDTGGVRVNDVPSWIGQNWNMNAGGVISRTIVGAVDEAYFPQNSNNPANIFGYYYTYNYLNSPTWNSQSNMENLAKTETTRVQDLEPDSFSFNFMGFSGKFFLGSDGQYKVQSNKNIKVIIDMNENQLILGRDTYAPFRYSQSLTWDAPKTIFKITLIDDNGNKYIFGNNQNAIEYSQSNFFDYLSGVLANSWYLTSVVDRLGNLVYSLEYDRGPYQAHFYYASSSVLREQQMPPLGGFGCIYSETSPFRTYGSLIAPSYLKKITTRNGYEINFNRSISNFKYFLSWDVNSGFQYWEDSGYNQGYSGWSESRFYLLFHDNNENFIPCVGYYRDDIFNHCCPIKKKPKSWLL